MPLLHFHSGEELSAQGLSDGKDFWEKIPLAIPMNLTYLAPLKVKFSNGELKKQNQKAGGSALVNIGGFGAFYKW